MATDETSAKERWAAATLKDIPFYRSGIRTSDFVRAIHEADYVTSVAEPVAGRKFGCNGVGKLTEVALHYPNEYSTFADNPQVLEDPRFWQKVIGLPDRPPVNLKDYQAETEALAKAYEANGVTVHWVEFPDSPMAAYGPMMGQVYLAWGNIYRGGSIISKMGWSPGAIGLTEYLAKWAWNELNIPVLTAITEGACEPGGCNFLAQDVIATAISPGYTEAGVDQFVSAIARTSGTEEFHNLVLHPAVEGFFNTANGSCSHPDMLIMAVDVGKVVIAPSIDWVARGWLEDNNFETIEADPDEQRAFLGPTNVVELEPGNILAHAECPKTNDKLKHAGLNVTAVPANELLKSGGGIKCRTMQIYREPGATLEDVRNRSRR